MPFAVLAAFLVACIAPSSVCALQSYPLATDNRYELKWTGETIEFRVDDEGANYTTKVSLVSLDVVHDDEIVDWIPETCIEYPSIAELAASSSNRTEGFKDIAESAGFTHHYRLVMPARPHCYFDFNIPIYNSSKNIRLKGEFCVPELIPAGAAIGDYDADGDADIFFTVHHAQSRLYRNNGDRTFTDVTEEANVGPKKNGSGAVWADFDADGDLDLYVTSIGDKRHFLYINQGGRFTEEAIERNVSGSREDNRPLAGMTPNVGDYDRDGYPDLYMTEWRLLTSNQDSSSRLFRNLGSEKPGYFEDVTELVGVGMDWLKRGNPQAGGIFTFCSSFTDFDEDGWPDLAVTADYGDSQMFWNNGNDTFTRCTEDCGITRRVDAMGHAIGDWNADQHMDWFSTGIHQNDENKCEVLGCSFSDNGNSLFTNANEGRGIRHFIDSTDVAKVRGGYWGWGATMIDFNNDKYVDFFMTNGFDSTSTTTDDAFTNDPAILWMNRGPAMNLSTVDVATRMGINNTRDGRGVMKFDFDLDGDEDVVVCHNLGKASLYENLGGNKNNWIRVKAMHRCPGQQHKLCDSLHARVKVTTKDGWVQTQEIGSGAHFMGQNEIEAHFGIGSAIGDLVDVDVEWPRLNVWAKYTSVRPNTRLRAIAPVAAKNSNRSIAFHTLDYCPRLKVTGISKVPPNATAWIGSDGRSIGFVALYSDRAQALSLDYTVAVEPASIGSGLNSTATAWLFVREQPYDSYSSDDDECSVKFASTPERRLDGKSNNLANTKWGSLNQLLHRDFASVYSDRIAAPATQCTLKQRNTPGMCPFPNEFAGAGSTRPPARVISNALFQQPNQVYSKRNVNDMLGQFGQFLAHDTDFSSPLPRFEFETVKNDVWLPISVPNGDVHFDPSATGNQNLPFVRSTHDRICTGRHLGNPREQINKLTSIIDASMVYGLGPVINEKLRTMKDGKMILENGGIIPYNTMGLPNDNPLGRPREKLLAAGDTRSNVQPGLIALHSLFVREHNRQCDEYIKTHPGASDGEIFAAARRFVIAELQAITFREFLPALIGRDVPPYDGYNPTVNPDVGNAFATAAFRYGHSQVNSHLWRFDRNWTVLPEGHLPLRDSYFAPERVIREGGIDPLLRGFIYQPAQAVDTKMIDDMRNVLFPVGRRDGLDLASMNIQRGRDHGLPDYNVARQKLGLPRLGNFSDFSDDDVVVTKLSDLYVSVDDVDMWVGGLAEKHVNGSDLGSFFETLLLRNFFRIRSGDRFWYERNMTIEEQDLIHNLTLSEIIRLNTDFKDVPQNAFFSTKFCRDVKSHQCVLKKKESECETTKSPSENPTMTMAPIATTASTSKPPVATTSASTTAVPKATTAAMTTTDRPVTTLSPTTASAVSDASCCSRLGNCTAEKSALNLTLLEARRNNSEASLVVGDLQEKLALEMAAANLTKRALKDLQSSCSMTAMERNALNLTVVELNKNVTNLQKQLDQLQANGEILKSSLNASSRDLDQVNRKLNACQMNSSSLEADKVLLRKSLSDVQEQLRTVNSSLANATTKLETCQTQILSTIVPTTSSSPTTDSPTTNFPTTTMPPTTQDSPTTPSPVLITTETPPTDPLTPSPCPTESVALIAQLKANVTTVNQQLAQQRNVAADLQARVNRTQALSDQLVKEKTTLQRNVTSLAGQLTNCDQAKARVLVDWTSCKTQLASRSTPPSVTPSAKDQPTTVSGHVSAKASDQTPTTTVTYVELQEKLARMENENFQIRSDNNKLLSENVRAKANITALESQISTFDCDTGKPSCPACSESFAGIIKTTPGIILVSVSGALLILFVIFLTLYVCARLKKDGKLSGRSQVYEFTAKEPTSSTTFANKGYNSSEDAFY